MRIKNYRSALLACGVIAISFATAASAAPVTGTVKLRLINVSATLQTGQPDKKPEDVAACRKQVSSITSRYLGMTVSTRYSVDPKSLIMSASSSMPSPVATKPVILTIPLAPLGIKDEYAFGAFRPSALPDTYVLFSMGTDFKNAQSSILVLNEGKAFNCLVSSSTTPFDGGLGTKLGSDQK